MRILHTLIIIITIIIFIVIIIIIIIIIIIVNTILIIIITTMTINLWLWIANVEVMTYKQTQFELGHSTPPEEGVKFKFANKNLFQKMHKKKKNFSTAFNYSDVDRMLMIRRMDWE